jgi:hypothetical protein
MTSSILDAMRYVCLLFCLLGASACLENSPAEPGPVDVQVVLAPGQQSAVAGTPLSLRFEAVTGDSRCPGDATCITGGDAVVRIAVIQASRARADYDLHTGYSSPVSHNGYSISLVELMPYPFTTRPIDPRDYRATVRVAR